MSPKACIIVDDEPLARERLERFVGRLPFLELVGSFEGAAEALAFARQRPPDLALLDVDLGGWSGLELLETRALRCPVVLTTAHAQFAVKAFELRVADYLLKPFTFERFVQAVDRALGEGAGGERTPPADSFFVRTDHRLERVWFSALDYIEGQDDYRALHLGTRELLTRETFAELERRLPPERVCRVHRSYMVAVDKVQALEGDEVLVAGRRLPLSDGHRERFLALLKHRPAE